MNKIGDLDQFQPVTLSRDIHRIHDGDTIPFNELTGDVRLQGVDTPEIAEVHGVQPTEYQHE